MSIPTSWQNKITRYAEEAPDQLLANPANWRIHPQAQQQALTGVLEDVGWIAPIICNETTGHVIDGHLRISLALRHNYPTVPVIYVALSEAEEAEALATFDPLSAMAATDAAQLDALLREVETTNEAVMQMLEDQAMKAGLIAGESVDVMPNLDPGEGRYKEQYGVIVICESESEQEQVYEALKEQGYTCRVVVT